MSEAVTVALITGGLAVLAAVLSQLIIAKSSAKDLYAKLDKQSELTDQQLSARLSEYQHVTDAKIDSLREAQERHNRLIERTYKLEEVTAVHSEQLKVANHRIEDLERLTTKP